MTWVKLQDVEQRLGINGASAQASMRLAVERGWLIPMDLLPIASAA
jgi:hypothetical protein